MYRFLKVNLNLKKESYKKDIDTFLSQKYVSQYNELVDKSHAPRSNLARVAEVVEALNLASLVSGGAGSSQVADGNLAESSPVTG